MTAPRFATRTIAAALLAALIAAVPREAAAQASEDDALRYQDCMAKAKNTPQAGFDAAIAWRDMGGGVPAEHCAAVALIALGHAGEAAGRLEDLGQRPTVEMDLRVGLLTQAAQAWQLAGQPERAYAVLTGLIAERPDDAALYVDRATARAELGHYEEAARDLTQAIELDPGRADAWVLRASARRYLDRLDAAASDLEQALALEPGHPEGHLERGMIRRLRGDDAGARQDWLAVIRQAPESAAADAARRNLELMDVDRNGDDGTGGNSGG